MVSTPRTIPFRRYPCTGINKDGKPCGGIGYTPTPGGKPKCAKHKDKK